MGSRRHIPALDGLRELAVLTVPAFHYGGGTQSSLRIMRVVYVFHMLFVRQFTSLAIAIFGEHNRTRRTLGLFLIAALGSILAAWLSFRFLETPFLRMKRRFSHIIPDEVRPAKFLCDHSISNLVVADSSF
jgi:peptidoglycan/LPS O-acetylase OafA/YrhL